MTLVAAERRFEQELEIFRHEVEGAAQFWFAARAMDEVASKNRRVLEALNRHALVWNTIRAALQGSAFIALGRVFDQDSTHNLDRLLGTAMKDREVFAKDALAGRKKRLNMNAAEWLDEYLNDVYVPRNLDFRELRSRVAKHRRIFVAQVRTVRNKVFAHRGLSEHSEIDAVFGQVNRRDVERLLVFLMQLHEVLWQVYFNGRRPVFRRTAYSSRNIARRQLDDARGRPVHERIVMETRRLLRNLSKAP